MHGKWFKIIGIVVAGLAVLVIAAIILAKVLITPERVRAAVLPVAEDFLHRPVDLERIEVSLFSGIACRGLVVGEREGQGHFIEAGVLELRYRFWPLLFGRVVIDEASLDSPAIRMSRDGDGRLNFADLLESSSENRQEGKPSERRNGSSINLLITRLSIVNGTVEFTDRAVRPEQAVVTRLDQLNLAARRLSLEEAFPIALDFRFNAAPVSWNGTVDPAGSRFAGKLRVSGLSAGPMAPYLGEALPGELRSLKLDADLEFDGTPRQVSSRGMIRFDDIAMTLEALPDAPIEGARLVIDHDLTAELERKRIAIRSLRTEYNRVALEVQNGTVAYSGPVQLDTVLRLPPLAVSDLVASLPADLARKLSAVAPSGQLEGHVDLSGSVSNLRNLARDGAVSLSQVGAQVGHLQPRLSGVVRLAKDELRAQQMQLEMAGSRFSLDLAAQRLFDEVKYLRADLRSGRVDFAALLPPEKKGEPTPAAGVAKPASNDPVDLPLEMEGEVRIAEGSYRGLDLKDIRLDGRLADNVVRFEEISTAAASGSLRGKAVIDLGRRQPAYDANVQIEDVDANALVTALAPRAAETVFGRLDLSMNLRGTGRHPAVLKRNLVGGGRFAIRRGELTGSGIMQGLSAFLDLDDLRVFRFDLGEGSFNIRDGSIFLAASFAGSKARLLPDGRLGFDRSIELSLKTFLSPEYTKKLAGRGTLGEVIADEKGWGLVPVRVAGTLVDPSFSLDRQALTEQVKKGAERKLKEKLQEKIREEIGEPSGEGEEDPAEKLLKDTLRGLFGN